MARKANVDKRDQSSIIKSLKDDVAKLSKVVTKLSRALDAAGAIIDKALGTRHGRARAADTQADAGSRIGACMLPNTCAETSRLDCVNTLGGQYQGDGTHCPSSM